ncbi:hypothetical protein D3C81_1206970 [compost metagenome]
MTTRVDATFRARRSSVATSRMVGNAAKSSGRRAYTHTSRTTIDRAMLKVKNTSSRNGGIGNIIIANITSSNSGTPRLPRPSPARLLRALLIN